MLISDEYRKQNSQLHDENKKFGNRGHKWVSRVRPLMAGCRDFLDYGCGKGTLVKELKGYGLRGRGYDPARPDFSSEPVPVDFVSCLDVLEHIEPEYLDNVLKHIKSLMKKRGFFVISLIPSDKCLPDGRNAHLIVEPKEWWIDRLRRHFKVEVVAPSKKGDRELAVVVSHESEVMPSGVFKKEWVGRRVIVLGRGPSVEKEDLSWVDGYPVIAVNEAYKFCPTADVVISGDARFFQKNKDFSSFKGRWIVSCILKPSDEPDVKDSRFVSVCRGMRRGISLPGTYVLNGGNTSVSMAIDLAYRKGASEIVLIGVDCHPGPHGQRRAWVSEKEPDDWKSRYGKQIETLRSMAAPLRDAGVSVYNANPDSSLKVWPVLRERVKAPSADEALKIVMWRWKGSSCYTVDHVHKLRNSIQRNLHIPHEFVLITDDPKGIDPDIRIVPMWNDLVSAKGKCFRRLKAFSSEMRELIGERFIWVDLDVVIVGDITPLLSRKEDFVISGVELRPQPYNGSLVLMNAGCREQVFTGWDWQRYQREKARLRYGGSDQAWIAIALGPNEATWQNEDGVYTYRDTIAKAPPVGTGGKLPENAKIIIFNGRYDPASKELQKKSPWIQEHWR